MLRGTRHGVRRAGGICLGLLLAQASGFAGQRAAPPGQTSSDRRAVDDLERSALRAFYSGDYSQALALLGDARLKAVETPRRLFYEACSNAALGLLEGPEGEARMLTARAEFARANGLGASFAVDRRYLSPRILAALRDGAMVQRASPAPAVASPVAVNGAASSTPQADRVQAELAAAARALDAGDYDGAERSYRSVLALDRSQTVASKGLDEIQRLRALERSTEVNGHLREAEKQYQAGNYLEALRKIDEALAIDRTSTRARELGDRIRKAMAADK